MEAPHPFPDHPLDPSTLAIQISIGQFLLILLLVNELVLRPLQELFKDHWLYCAARTVVSDANLLQITPAPYLLRAFGIENYVTTPCLHPRLLLWMPQLFRILLLVLLILAAALFERSVDQQRFSTVSEFRTAALGNASVAVRRGETTLISPFPVFGLTEQQARDIAPFEPAGTNSSSRYIVRENPIIAAEYISSCVRQFNDSYVVVYVGAVVLANATQKVMCLDGTGGSETRIAGQFFSTVSKRTAVNVQSVTLSRLANERGFSTDNVSGVFAADILDENNEQYKGYAAITKRSHYHGDVVWSMYALVRRNDSIVWRVSLRLVWLDCKQLPCRGGPPSLGYVGTWTFSNETYVCPDQTEYHFTRKDQDRLQTVSLEIFPASEQKPENNADLLAWLIETDFARFVAAEFFEWELRSRVRSDRLFYTTHEGERMLITDGGSKEVVTMGRRETVVFLTAVAALLIFILASSIWNCMQSKRLNMDSEMVSFQAVSAMYQSENDAKGFAQELPLKIGLTNTERDTQHLGLIVDGTASKRRPNFPLD